MGHGGLGPRAAWGKQQRVGVLQAGPPRSVGRVVEEPVVESWPQAGWGSRSGRTHVSLRLLPWRAVTCVTQAPQLASAGPGHQRTAVVRLVACGEERGESTPGQCTAARLGGARASSRPHCDCLEKLPMDWTLL